MDWSWIGNPHNRQWQTAFLIGTWLAGVGTVAVACMTFWLARRDRRVNIKLIATLGNPVPNHTEGQVLLRVWNLGPRAVTVSGIGFGAGFLPAWSPFLAKTNVVLYPNSLPYRQQLSDGGEFGHDESFHPLVVQLADLLPSPIWLSAYSLRFWAHTTVDESRSDRVRPLLRRRVATMTGAQARQRS